MLRIMICAIVVAATGCTSPDESLGDNSSCLSDLAAHRSSKDVDFATDESPLSNEQKADFDGLDYYPPNAEYCIPANFEEAIAAETFDMPTTGERKIPVREFGVFEFHIDGVPYSLTAYQVMSVPEEERQQIVVPFKDDTNGHETYGGGRYLLIQLPIDSQTEIDFNRAFNPMCAYDAKYNCAIPPVKNWLSVRIEAGEKMFRAEHSESS